MRYIITIVTFAYCLSLSATDPNPTDPSKWNYPSTNIADRIKAPDYPIRTVQLVNDRSNHFIPKESDSNDLKDIFLTFKNTFDVNKVLSGAIEIGGTVAATMIAVANPAGGILEAIGLQSGSFAAVVGAQVINENLKGVVNSAKDSIHEAAILNSSKVFLSSVKELYSKDKNFFFNSPQEKYRKVMALVEQKGLDVPEIMTNRESNAIIQTYLMQAMNSQMVKEAEIALERGVMSESLLNQLKQSDIDLKEMTGEQGRDILDRINKLGMGIIQIEKNRQKDHQAMVAAQNEMVSSASKLLDVTLVQGQITETNLNVRTLKEFMFTRMSPEEQRANLDRMKDVYNKDAIKAMQSRLNFDVTMSNIFKGGGAAVDIARKLGVSPKLCNTVSKALQVAEAGKNLFLSLSTSVANPLGMLASANALMGLFGAQSDPAEARHAEIMQSFKAISEQIRVGNEAILKELGKIEEALQTISQQVAEVDKKVSIIGGQVIEINAKLTSIQYSLNGLEIQSRGGFYQEYEKCRDNFLAYISESKSYNEMMSLFTSLGWVAKTNSDMAMCLRGFDAMFVHKGISGYFKQFTEKQDDFTRYNFHTSWKLITKLIDVAGNDQIHVGKLVTPNHFHWALDAKHKSDRMTTLDFEYGDLGGLDVADVTDAVLNYLKFYPLTYLFTVDTLNNNIQLSPYQILPNQERPGTPLAVLKNALKVVQMSIAEYTLIGGDDALYPIIAYARDHLNDEQFWINIKELMAINPVFAHNFLVLWVRNFMLDHHSHDRFYEMAIELDDKIGGRRMIDEFGLPFQFEFEVKNGLKYAYFNYEYEVQSRKTTAKIYMPTVKDVYDGRLESAPELIGYMAVLKKGGRPVPQIGLLQLRNQLIEAISEIRTLQKIQDSKNEKLKQAYINLLD